MAFLLLEMITAMNLKSPKPGRVNPAAFTLVELMVTVGVLAIACFSDGAQCPVV